MDDEVGLLINVPFLIVFVRVVDTTTSVLTLDLNCYFVLDNTFFTVTLSW